MNRFTACSYRGLVPMLILTAVGLIVLAGCSSTPAEPRVNFTQPTNGASVTSPFTVKMAVQNFKVEPAGPVNPGAGHFHITIDAECVPPGQVIPNDDQHKHFGQAQLETELTLPPGTHRLCLQMADGAHVALSGAGMTQQISITVR